MTIDYRGTTALITGASAGLGAEYAEQFARRGTDLVLVARRTDRLDALAERLHAAHGVGAQVVGLDVGEPDAAARLRAELAERGIRVDHVVNNAGFGMKGALAAADAARLDEMVRVNVGAVVAITRAFLPDLLAAGRGTLVNIASNAAFQPCPSMAVYGATKAFVLSFTEAVSYEVRGTGVAVLAVCPGATRTEFFDVMGTEAIVGSVQTAEQVVAATFGALERRNPPPSIVGGVLNRVNAKLAGIVPRRLALAVSARLLGA
ncbi:SDR family NAD(P)-dependent oxidoreductase [Microbacterium ulmi]|uniref:SDR family oxidoreductase n=1 Tax=Microbacterium ulmi TaxID=179095 RepID=A0A7Y2LYM4_9MICO|nr:SDR family oxidoreductase [Microbacterium ulmi]NII69805.1 hypothetical protein [Microbacterium ulmi]NNH03224.1 SDR family oxidoreductase [Microbacterium ulmi]